MLGQFSDFTSNNLCGRNPVISTDGRLSFEVKARRHSLEILCEICGKPTSLSRLDATFCDGCQDRYDAYLCSRCGGRVVILREIEHSDICSVCDLRARVDGLAGEEREAIRGLIRSGQRVRAIKEATRMLGINVGEATFVVEELKD
jgi:hypothetical protein